VAHRMPGSLLTPGIKNLLVVNINILNTWQYFWPILIRLIHFNRSWLYVMLNFN
jgi:hypothetical protein